MNDYKSRITDFIHSLYDYAEGSVPLHAPVFSGNEKKYLAECIDTTYVSSVGKFVDRFEQMIADYTGAARAVVCVNGTNALHMAMMLAGVSRGDEVITQALSFIATCNAISYIGAQPVFIDIDTDTLGLSPHALELWLEKNAVIRDGQCYNRITGNRIAACVPMHTFGHPVHIDVLADLCLQWHIPLVEDAAESIGSFYKGRHTGTFGLIGAISFNGNKTITTGGGGMILFADRELGDRAKHLTTQAKLPHRWAFVHDSIGYNYRMPNINAALGCAQMEHIEEFVADKRRTAGLYAEFFSTVPEVEFFTEPDGSRSNYWLNAVITRNRTERDRLLEYTNDHGVMTRPVWEVMTNLPMFAGCRHDGLANTLHMADRIVNIPSGVRLKTH